MNLTRRLRLFANVFATVVALIAAKFLAHYFKVEFLTLDTLFSSVVAGAIFIVGFLLTSTLPDYKEAERLPAEIRVALEGIHDDVECFALHVPLVDTPRLRVLILEILTALERGLGNEGHHSHLEEAMARADDLVPYFSQLEKLGMPNNYVVRIRGGLDALRKSLYRISYIQKIEFVPSVNVLIQTLVVAVVALLLVLKSDGSYGSFLIFGFVSYLFVFAMHLIAVFKQPFRQGEHSPDKVSLYLLRELAAKLLEKQSAAPAGATPITPSYSQSRRA
jgi:hypothetical protein